MQLTTDESERAAVAANNQPLALAWGRIIDLEQERLQLRDLLRDAGDTLGQCLPFIDAHRRASGGDGDLSAMNAREVIERVNAALDDDGGDA
jgi:hypothetical protein